MEEENVVLINGRFALDTGNRDYVRSVKGELKKRELRLTLLQRSITFCRDHGDVKISRKEGRGSRAAVIEIYHKNGQLQDHINQNFDEINGILGIKSCNSLVLSETEKKLFWYVIRVVILDEQNERSVDGFDWLMQFFA